MLYNVVLVSALQQSESAIYTHISLLFWISFPFRSPQIAEWASLLAQMIKNPPAMQEIWVSPLGQKDPLEKGMATHSSILSWRIPWTEEPGGLHPCGHKESDTTEGLTHKHTQTIEWSSLSSTVGSH